MKISFDETKQGIEISDGFFGLAQDDYGDIWLLNDKFGLCVQCKVATGPLQSIFEDYGPFTKYNGKLVIEND